MRLDIRRDSIDFWRRLDSLIASTRIIIDRRKGSIHPRYSGLVYPLDYGYLDGTLGGDGNAIDVWQGSQKYLSLVGITCTVDSLKKDAELKLLISCDPGDVEAIRMFYRESEYFSAIILLRESATV